MAVLELPGIIYYLDKWAFRVGLRNPLPYLLHIENADDVFP